MENKSIKFEQYREEYKEFHFKKYLVYDDKNAIYMQFIFDIPGLVSFNPKLKILKKNLKFKDIKSQYVQNMVFHIGMIELISYWKSTCSPNVIIECGYLNQEQINWWKKLYFYGLGELFYTNNIETNINDFMKIKCTTEENNITYDKIASG